MKEYSIPDLPLPRELESRAILKEVLKASRQLAELKGVIKTIPNENILINSLTLQEAQDSSAVENIITTQDELYQAELNLDGRISLATKEVQRYASALRQGFLRISQAGVITRRHILDIQAELEQNNAGVRAIPGTQLKNDRTGEVIYTPPQHPAEINRLIDNLLEFINDNELSDLDPLVKMAVIHHQFESIHPFYDGNGRTGRILNILYLVNQGLLDLPILYLSQYIIQNKQEYYHLLQKVRDEGDWETWITYIVRGVTATAADTIRLTRDLKSLMQEYKVTLRRQEPRIYSQDLLNNIFRHPYTKIEFVMNDLRVSRPTATAYLGKLSGLGILTKHKLGRSHFYVNDRLVSLLTDR
ncbi:Fic family protein [Lewinella sp. IMCC34183]|uniref:Fic family protein n=1 Tax=Lewinella sp. IMCC34183 TaxID=2248762 RepID=UPI000E26C39B|nr:Fic family protein [Lewinella sp. IMCC34183]